MREVKASHLYIAGTGGLESELREYIHQHQIENVTLLGHLETEPLIKLVQRAQFLVAPSECYDNYPMSVLEAQACATPVIGANIGGIPEDRD